MISIISLLPSFALISCLRCVLIPLIFETIRNTVNPEYSNPACLLKLVNETQSGHYQAHPFYSGIKSFSTDGKNCDLQGFVDMQYNQNEKQIFEGIIIAWGIFSVLYILYKGSFREMFSIKYLIFQFVSLQLFNTLLMSYVHFGQDIVYFCGNIMHHCNISAFKAESNASLVSMLPQGFALSSTLTLLWGVLIQTTIVSKVPSLKKFLSPSVVCFSVFLSLVFVVSRVKYNHPVMHEIATRDMLNANPFTFEWRAAQHVFVHHGNGDSFGPSCIFDPLFSKALYLYSHLHNNVFKLVPGELNHYAFAIGFDVLLGVFCSVIMTVIFHVTNFTCKAVSSGFGLFGKHETKTKGKDL